MIINLYQSMARDRFHFGGESKENWLFQLFWPYLTLMNGVSFTCIIKHVNQTTRGEGFLPGWIRTYTTIAKLTKLVETPSQLTHSKLVKQITERERERRGGVYSTPNPRTWIESVLTYWYTKPKGYGPYGGFMPGFGWLNSSHHTTINKTSRNTESTHTHK